MTDPEGVNYGVSDPVWYDDGHSADWVHGVVSGFPAGKVAIMKDNGPNTPAIVNPPLVHVGKPVNPPDRG